MGLGIFIGNRVGKGGGGAVARNYNIVFEGHSFLVGGDFVNRFVSEAVSPPVTIGSYQNSAVDGSVIGHMAARVTTSVDAHREDSPLLNLMVIWIGVNDLRYVNGDTAYNNLRNYIVAQKAKGWGVILLTCTPSNYVGLPVDFETRRGVYNEHLKEDFTDLETVWTFDTDTVSQTLDPDNTTYYSDKLHPTQALHYLVVDALLNNINLASIGAVIADIPIPETTIPTVVTSDITNISLTTATGGGNVTDNGGASVTARGVCWGASANPTTADSKTTDGSGDGSFASSITSLIAGNTYHVRAYATNSVGTAYGQDVEFTAANYIIKDTFTDTDNTHLHDHTMDMGSGWTAADEWVIIGNKLDCNGINGYAVTEAGQADVTVSMDVLMQDSSLYYSAILFRYQDDSNTLKLALYKNNSVNSGIPRIILYENAIERVTANVTQEEITGKLRVVANGDNISGYWKDMETPLITYSTSAYNDKTKVGVQAFEGAGIIFRLVDNFEVL